MPVEPRAGDRKVMERFVLEDIILLILYTSGLMEMTICSFRLGKMTGRKMQFPVSPSPFVPP